MLEKLQYVAIVTGRSGLRGVIRVSISRVRHDTLISCVIFIRKQDSRHIGLCEPPDRGLLRTILSSDISGFLQATSEGNRHVRLTNIDFPITCECTAAYHMARIKALWHNRAKSGLRPHYCHPGASAFTLPKPGSSQFWFWSRSTLIGAAIWSNWKRGVRCCEAQCGPGVRLSL